MLTVGDTVRCFRGTLFLGIVIQDRLAKLLSDSSIINSSSNNFVSFAGDECGGAVAICLTTVLKKNITINNSSKKIKLTFS